MTDENKTRDKYGSATGDDVNNLPELCLPAEVANFFRVSKQVVAKWLRDESNNKPFPNSFKLGGTWRIPRGDVIDYTHRLYGKGD